MTAGAMPLRLSLAQWSLHRAIRDGAVDGLDFPRLARREFGIEAVELVNTLVGEPRRERLEDLRRRAAGEAVEILLIMVDDEGDLSHPRRRLRRKAVRNHERWIDAAAHLGARAVRVNTGGPAPRRWDAPPEDPHLRGAIERCAESIADLAAYAAPAKISVLLENHGGLSASIPAMLAILEAAGKENTGTLPDFGNFGAAADRYAAVARMLPRARAVSAKTFDFDAAGMETTIDYPRMLGLVRDAGYGGPLGIEYEGRRLPEREGIQRSKALLEKLMSS